MADARCVYYGDDDSEYNCSPICTGGRCPAGLECGGNGEDIDAGYYNVCFPPSNTCQGWKGG
jgi:hypothetical protein